MSSRLWGSVSAETTPVRYAGCAGVLALAQESVIRVWALDAAASVPPLLLAPPPAASALAIGDQGDGVKALVAANAGQCSGWLLKVGTEAHELSIITTWSLPLSSFGPPPADGGVRSAHFDGSGKRLALCAGLEVWVIDVQARRPLLRLQGHAAPTCMSSFAGALLLSVAEDRCFHLWRLPPVGSASAEAELLVQVTLPPGSATTLCAALSPLGSQLVLGDAAGRLHVYELELATRSSRAMCRCTHRVELGRALARPAPSGAAEASSALPATLSSAPAWQHQQQQPAVAATGGAADASVAILAAHYAPLPPAPAAAALGRAERGERGCEWGVVVATPAATVLLRDGVWRPHVLVERGPREAAAAASLLCEAAASALGWRAEHGELWLLRASAFQPWLRVWRLSPDLAEAEAEAEAEAAAAAAAAAAAVDGVGNGDGIGAAPRSVLSQSAPLPASPLAAALAALAAPSSAAAPTSAGRARPKSSSSSTALRGSPPPKGGRRADQPVTFHRKISSSGYGTAPVMKLHSGGPMQAAAAAAAAAKRAAAAKGGGAAAATRAYTPSEGPICCLQHDNSAAAPPLGGAQLRARYSPDAARLAVGGAAGEVTLLRLPTRRHCGGAQPPPLLSGHTAAVSSVQWSHSGQLLLTASADASVRLWDVSADRPPAAPLLALRHLRHSPPAMHAGDGATSDNPLLGAPVRQAAFFYLDRLLLLACGNALHLHSYALNRAADDAHRAAELRHSHRLHHRWAVPNAQHVTCFAAANSFLSPVALVAASDRSVTAVDLGVGRAVCTWRDMHERAVHSLSLYEGSAHTAAPEAARDLFLSSATDGAVRLWDLRTAACARCFAAHLNRVHAVGAALSPCLRYVVTGSEDKQAYVYDVRSGRLTATLGGHLDAVTDVAFSPLHPQLASVSLDGRVRFFADGREG